MKKELTGEEIKLIKNKERNEVKSMATKQELEEKIVKALLQGEKPITYFENNTNFPEGERTINFIRQMLDEGIFILNGNKIRFNKK